MEPQLPVGLEPTEIGETGCVIEENAKSQLTPTLVVREVLVFRIVWQRLRKIVGYRAVEIEFLFIHELHHHVGEGGFCERSSVHHGVWRQRIAFRVADSERVKVDDASIANQRDREALNVVGAHQGFDGRVDGGGRQSPSIKGPDRLSRGNGRKRQASTKRGEGSRCTTHRSGVRKCLPGSSKE